MCSHASGDRSRSAHAGRSKVASAAGCEPAGGVRSLRLSASLPRDALGFPQSFSEVSGSASRTVGLALKVWPVTWASRRQAWLVPGILGMGVSAAGPSIISGKHFARRSPGNCRPRGRSHALMVSAAGIEPAAASDAARPLAAHAVRRRFIPVAQKVSAGSPVTWRARLTPAVVCSWRQDLSHRG